MALEKRICPKCGQCNNQINIGKRNEYYQRVLCEHCKTYYTIEDFQNDNEKELYWANYFSYTLHELPIGVLIDADGADINGCDELLKDLAQYEALCKRLNIDRTSLISECRFYYNTYRAYLTCFKDYKGFDDYLNKNK